MLINVRNDWLITQKICPYVKYNVSQLGIGVQMPNYQRNYCQFNGQRVGEILKQADHALPVIDEFLKTTQNEAQVCEALYVLDRMLDNNVKNVDKLYPTLSRFNYTNSPNIQVLLAGIYRKTLIPDAYGPLHRMMAQQIYYPNSPFFDPTEEIGGAILEYNRSYGVRSIYKNNV